MCGVVSKSETTQKQYDKNCPFFLQYNHKQINNVDNEQINEWMTKKKIVVCLSVANNQY